VAYCGQECQLVHWNANHKLFCGDNTVEPIQYGGDWDEGVSSGDGDVEWELVTPADVGVGVSGDVVVTNTCLVDTGPDKAAANGAGGDEALSVMAEEPFVEVVDGAVEAAADGYEFVHAPGLDDSGVGVVLPLLCDHDHDHNHGDGDGDGDDSELSTEDISDEECDGGATVPTAAAAAAASGAVTQRVAVGPPALITASGRTGLSWAAVTRVARSLVVPPPPIQHGPENSSNAAKNRRRKMNRRRKKATAGGGGLTAELLVVLASA